jgi:sugar phosphate isomerase/epimerase
MPTRRRFLRDSIVTSAAVGLGAAAVLTAAEEADSKRNRPPRVSGSQRRWRTAFGLNGFVSAEQEFGNSFPIWEVLQFAQREGFEGIELVQNWPKPYPSAEDERSIASLRDFYARYNLKIFSIQTSAAGAFRKSRTERTAWLRQFADRARFTHKAGCECIGLWPGGRLGDQTLPEARTHLIESLREVAKIVSDQNLMASVEIEPPFVFHTIDDLIAIVDGVDHSRVKAMYDPSHFDLMSGGKGKPEELLLRLGVDRVGYIHLTDSDGTLFGGTSKHLPCGDGHLDIPKSLETLWTGGYEGWIMIDPWKTKDPYDACRKGRHAIENARRVLASDPLSRRDIRQ